MLGNVRALIHRLSRSLGARIAQVALLVASLLLGAHWLIDCVDHFYAIKDWLIWRYCGYWLGSLFFALSCLVAGLPVVQFLGRDFRYAERLLLAYTTGVVVFFLGMFVLGLLGLYYPATFFLWPLALLAIGGPAALRLFKRLRRLRRVMYARPRRPLPLLQLAALGFGLLSLVIVYSQIIHPLNTSYDARWYHLSIAEQYAARGRIITFTNGSFVNAYPHLTSFLYTWAFLAPRATLFDKVGLCSHMTFITFGVILAGVTLLTRRLLRRYAPSAWSVVFLFPGLFLYDSGLHLGSDHVAAMFAVPVALTTFITCKRWTLQNWLLLAVTVAGAALTKYSVVALFAVPTLALSVRGLLGLVRAEGRKHPLRWLTPPVVGALVALVLTAPHWARNWLAYGNPIYPYADGLFPHQHWAAYNRRIYTAWKALGEWVPQGTLRERLKETAHAVPRFAFEPHDWPAFHRDVPVFGFLFSLTGLCLPFVRGRTRRIWLLSFATYCGIFLWYWGMHQDRYLQLLLPWMAAATAAILVLAWRTSPWAKLPVAALVALQVAWGSDVPFIPGHAMLGKPPTTAAIELASSGYRQQIAGRLDVFEPFQSISKALDPRHSCVLVHDQQLSFGIGSMVLQDMPHMQGILDYGSQPSLGAVYRMLKGAGVTHILWLPRTTTGFHGWAGDFVFFDFLRDHTGPIRKIGGEELAPLKDGPDLDLRNAKVLFLTCPSGYARGLYSLASVNFPDVMVNKAALYPKPERALKRDGGADDLLAQSRYVAFDPSCNRKAPAALEAEFTDVATRSSIQLWIRKEQRLHR